METKAEDYFIDKDAKTYYETAGQGDHLILAHTGFIDSGMWDEQFAFFSQYYRVTRFDMRGYGRSTPIQGPINRREDLYRLIKHLGIEKAVLVGCSLGGEIILDAALERPELVSALVVVSAVPGGFEMQGDPPPNLLEMIAALEQKDVERASDLQVRIWVDGPFRQPEEVDAPVRQRAAEMNRTAVANGTYLADLQPLQPLDPPAVHRLSEIRVPTLIITGAVDHPEILRAGAFMEKEIPSARYVIIPETGHVPNMERPDLFNQAVLGFLKGG